MKREKPLDLLNDVVLCLATGWTLRELEAQDARFVEKLTLYLNVEAEKRQREINRMREETERMGADNHGF